MKINNFIGKDFTIMNYIYLKNYKPDEHQTILREEKQIGINLNAIYL